MTTPLIKLVALAVEACGPIGCCIIDERDAAAIAKEALTALTEAGYAIVPVEPTDAMDMAAHNFLATEDGDAVTGCYRAMIRAAQGTSGFAQDAKQLGPQGAGPVRQDAPEPRTQTHTTKKKGE